MQNASCIWSYILSMHRAAKRVKGPKQGGGKQSQGQSKSAPNYKSSGPIKEGCGLSLAHHVAQTGLSASSMGSSSRYPCDAPAESCASLQEQRACSSSAWCRAAYEQETRTTILALDKVSKVAPNGKQVLKDVGLGMYKGAKIGKPWRHSCPCLKHVAFPCSYAPDCAAPSLACCLALSSSKPTSAMALSLYSIWRAGCCRVSGSEWQRQVHPDEDSGGRGQRLQWRDVQGRRHPCCLLGAGASPGLGGHSRRQHPPGGGANAVCTR